MLDTLGAGNVSLGDGLTYDAEAWAALERGERPERDVLADAFFHLARVEERSAPAAVRDAHGRFPSSASCLDPLDPPLERLRSSLGVEPPRWFGARFAVALTHDVDVPWRWTRVGLRGAGSRIKRALASSAPGTAVREAGALATAPVHRVKGTDPNWTFERVAEEEAERGARSTFFVMAGHAHRADGPSAAAYARVRPRLVATLLERGAEVGLHGSYTAAEEPSRLAAELEALEGLAGTVAGQRFHYLRVDPHLNLRVLDSLGFRYDSSLGFADTIGFRAGIAHPFRPWDFESDRALELVEIPLAAMDATLGEPRYLGLSVSGAEARVTALLDRAAERGGGFALLWHNEWFDERAFPGWGRLYFRLMDEIAARGGVCVSAGELAEEAAAWLR